MALSRLMLVWYPVDTKFKNHNFVLKSILFLVILSLVICLSFTIILKIHFRILPTSLCLPFIDSLKSVFMIKIIVWSSILTQSMLSIVIVIVYILLALSLYAKKDNDLNQKSTHISYKSLILQLILITVSNISCWFSTNGIYTMTMILSKYPTQLVIWSTVILMPINSIVNPTIFLFYVIQKLSEIKVLAFYKKFSIFRVFLRYQLILNLVLQYKSMGIIIIKIIF